MDESFDPYRKWLGIRTRERPPNHYQLLGLELFEDDPETISHAAGQRITYVRTLAVNDYADVSQRVLNELATAKVCLLNATKKAAYDRLLRQRSRQQGATTAVRPQASMPPRRSRPVATAPVSPTVLLRTRPRKVRQGPSLTLLLPLIAAGTIGPLLVYGAWRALRSVAASPSVANADRDLVQPAPEPARKIDPDVPQSTPSTQSTASDPVNALPPPPASETPSANPEDPPVPEVQPNTVADLPANDPGAPRREFDARGLRREWFEGQSFANLLAENIVATVSCENPPERANGPFSVRWTGSLRPSITGAFKLGVLPTQGVVRLCLDDRWIIASSSTTAYESATRRAFVDLDEREHFLQIEFLGSNCSQAQLELSWECKGRFAESPVPETALAHDLRTKRFAAIAADGAAAAMAQQDANRQLTQWTIAHGGRQMLQNIRGGSILVGLEGQAGEKLLLVGALFRDTVLTGEDLKQFSNLPHFTQLQVPLATDAVVDTLWYIPGLGRLQLVNPQMTAKGWRRLKQLSALSGLWISGPEFGNPEVDDLLVLPQIGELFLGDTKLNAKGFQRLLLGSPTIHTLYLHRVNFTRPWLTALSKLPLLRCLYLAHVRISDEDLALLAELKLNQLHLWDIPISDAAIKRLTAAKELTQIDLRQTRVTEKAVEEFRSAHRNCSVNWLPRISQCPFCYTMQHKVP